MCRWLLLSVVVKEPFRLAHAFPDPISQNPSQKGMDLVLRPTGLRRATGSVDLAWLLRDASPQPDFHARERDVEETTQGEG